MRALIRNLPTDSATQRHTRAVAASVAAKPSASPAKKVDYDALRALGGEVIRVPRGA